MRKLIAIMMALTSLTTTTSMANTMSIDKQRLIITDKDKRTEFKVFNTSSDVQSIRVSFIEKQMDENGEIKNVEHSDNSAADYLRVGPRVGRNLGPKAYQKFRIRAKLAKLHDGEYRSHLLFESMNPPKEETKSGIHVKPNIRYSIPVIIRKGEVNAQIAITDAKIAQDEEQKPVVEFNVTREGNRSVYGDIDIYRINQGKAELVSTTVGEAIYTDVNQRKFTIPLEQAVNASSRLKIVFRENPDFGGDQTAETII